MPHFIEIFGVLPRWALMWLVAIAVYFACKLLTWTSARPSNAPPWQHLAYLLAWPGMNANRFLQPAKTVSQEMPSLREWAWVIAKIAIGCVLLWGFARWLPEYPVELRGWTILAGLAFILHFGGFHFLSVVWRSFGLAAEPIMHSPITATSLGDFWSRRWNRAYRDLTHQFVMRPLAPRIGTIAAAGVGFLISGIIHDVVISLPAGGGVGGPTLFFAIQAFAISLERSAWGKRIGLGQDVVGWFFTMFALVLPAPLLFHRPFLQAIAIPFAEAIGALP